MKVLNSVELFKKTYDRLLTDVAKKNNLTLIELKILMFLEKNESNVAKDIVEGIQATKSHVSMAVCDLEKKGYIEKISDKNDKKKCHLQLTKNSSEVVKIGNEVQKQIKEIMFYNVTKEELEVLNYITKKIQDNLQNYNKN